MTSPGGAEVGRVSVRVVPNTDGFRERARAGLERELANLEVEVKVEPDLTGFNERVRAELARIAGESAKVDIELNLDENAIRERLRAIVNGAQAGITADIEIRWVPSNAILKAQLRAKVLAAQAGVRADVDVNFDIDRNRLQQAVSGFGGGGGGGGGIFDFLPNVVQRWTAIIGLLSPLILAAGAAITEAWAAVSVAILAIPPLVALIGVPIAAIILGISGIRDAFQKLQPEIDKSYKQLSDVFRVGFGVGVDQFLLPALKDVNSSGVLKVLAGDISNVFIDVAEVVRNNSRLIASEIAAIGFKFRELGGPIAGFVDSILQILSVPNALDAIATPIELFLENWRSMVDEVTKDGTLNEAFKGLASVLGNLSRALVDLIENGVRTFKTSWPGFDDFIRGITDFFNKFDWERLGTAVGNTLGGIGDALKNIDPAVIEQLTRAFEGIGVTFKDKGFQDSLANIISLIPDLIALLTEVTNVLVRLGSIFAGVIDIMSGFALGIIGLAQLASGDIVGGMNSLRESAELGRLGIKEIKDAFSNGAPEIGRAIGQVEHTITGGLKKIEKSAKSPEVKKSIDSALKPGDKDYVPEWQQKTDGISKAVQDGMLKAGIEGQAGADVVAKSLSPVGKTDTINQEWASIADGIVRVISDTGRFIGEAGGLVGSKFITGLTTYLGLAPVETGKALTQVETTIRNDSAKGGAAFQSYGQSLVDGMKVGLRPLPVEAAGAVKGAHVQFQIGFGEIEKTVGQGASNVERRTGEMPGNIKASLGDTSSLLTEAGRQIMNSLKAGLEAAWGAVQTFVRGIAGWIQANKGPISKDKKLLKPAGHALMKGLQTGLVEGFLSVQAVVRDMAGDISQQFQNGINWFDVSAVPESMQKVSGTVTSNVTGSIAPGDVTGIAESVSTALAGWSVEIDQQGIAKLVNKQNLRNRRR